MPIKAYRFTIRTFGNGVGDQFTKTVKTVMATGPASAWKKVTQALAAADLLDIVTEIRKD